MPATVNLSANLESVIEGAELGGYLRITLCGFGPVIPCVDGVAMLADAGIPQLIGPQQGSTPLTVALWGNDAITPQNTFYEIAVLDQDRNVIQTGMYQFTQGNNVDLSSAAQILPPFGFLLTALRYQQCTGALIGGNRIFIAPGSAIAATYNGILMNSSQCTISGNVVTLSFDPEIGDRIDAFCIS